MVEQAKQVVGYVRVSVDNETKVSPEMQTEALEQYCELKGWELVDVIVERGKSAGEGKKRPGLDRVRRMIRRGAASGLIVWKIDRCSRSVRDFSEILAELQKYKADFVSVTESFDTSSAIGVAMLQITMVFAQLERARSSERLTAWHTYRAKQGKPPASAPLGYRRVDGEVMLDEETAPLVKQAVSLYLETGSTTVVQRFLADHGHSKYLTATRKLLRSPTLAGLRVVDGVNIPGGWPAIITVADHEQVLATLAGTKGAGRRGRPKRPRQLLSSIAVCGRCGCPMLIASAAAKTGTPRDRYQCSSNKGTRTSGPDCFISVWADLTDEYVEKLVLAFITPEKWQRMRAGRQTAPTPVFVDNVALEAKLAALAEDWAHDRISRAEWDAARAALLSRITETQAAVDMNADDEVDLPDVADLHKAWPKLPIEAKRLVITAVVDRIVVAPAFLIPGRKNGWAPVENRVEIFWR